jgi:hypothetical protein
VDSHDIVWARAIGWSWARIGRTRHETWHGKGQRPPKGNSKFLLEQLEHKALRFLANEVNLAGIPLREATEFARLPPIPRRAEQSA